MTDKFFLINRLPIIVFTVSATSRISFFLLLFIQILFINPKICQGSEIVIRLSGEIDHPGDLSLLSKTIELKKVCFLGVKAKGKIDGSFLRLMSRNGTPKGDYEVAPPFPDEGWPTRSFTKNGALRLKIVGGSGLQVLRSSNKSGIAIHGRDFYPLLDGIVKKKIMINFYNDALFERLQAHWGPLRISNWDMGRLADSWVKINQSSLKWKVKVVEARPEEIESACKPPIVRRTVD